MATETTKYKLVKPAQEDFYNIDVQNENMDKIEAALEGKVEKVDGKGLSQNDYTSGDKSKVDKLPSDTSAELDKKANSTDVSSHTGNANIHVTSSDKQGWSAKMDKVASAVAGKIPQMKADGSLENSGKSISDFADKAHESSSVTSEGGIHGVRYYDKKLQVYDGEWKQAGGGVGIEVNVTVDSGSVVTATDGTSTITGNASGGTLKIIIPNYGAWSFSATLNGKTSNTVALNCDTSKVYTVSLTYFMAQIKVTAVSGAVVTLSKSGKVQTATSNGTATFTVDESGAYSIYATYDGINSNTVTVNATVNGQVYTATPAFIILTVGAPQGSDIVVKKGAYSYAKSGSGSVFTFYLPETGTWAVTAVLNGNTATDTIACSAYTNYTIRLNYYKVYGVDIDLSNSNPETAVTYTDSAVGMSAGSADWNTTPIFSGIRPCILVDGVVTQYLNPDNFALDVSGSSTSNAIAEIGKDVMIEIPKLGYKITTSGNTVSVKVTDNPNATAEGFHYYAHTRATEGDCSKLYIGAYLGRVNGDKLYSSSGKSPSTNKNIGEFRTAANARGDYYDLLSFYPLTLIQCLYLIRYKNLNAQAALGNGYSSADATKTTGSFNGNGMYYGSTSSLTVSVKFAGIEDIYGNAYQVIDGLYIDSSRNILTAFGAFNNSASGYTSRGKGASADISGYMSKPQGTTETGFITRESNGSGTTYFCDNGTLKASCIGNFGGAHNPSTSSVNGMFRLYLSNGTSTVASNSGARLMYLKPDA